VELPLDGRVATKFVAREDALQQAHAFCASTVRYRQKRWRR
jgi:hypothetical protein